MEVNFHRPEVSPKTTSKTVTNTSQILSEVTRFLALLREYCLARMRVRMLTMKSVVFPVFFKTLVNHSPDTVCKWAVPRWSWDRKTSYNFKSMFWENFGQLTIFKYHIDSTWGSKQILRNSCFCWKLYDCHIL